MTILGYTGTRRGMTRAQTQTIIKIVTLLNPYEAHHGDCIGGDADFHAIIWSFGVVPIIHPPTDEKLRAFCEPGVILEPKPYLERDRDIVTVCGLLIAAPDNYVFKIKSGTWYTVAYALKIHRDTVIVYPDGTFQPQGTGTAK